MQSVMQHSNYLISVSFFFWWHGAIKVFVICWVPHAASTHPLKDQIHFWWGLSMTIHWHTGLPEMLQMYHITFVQGFNYEGVGKVLRPYHLCMSMDILSWIKTITDETQSNSYIATQGCQWWVGSYNIKWDGKVQLQNCVSTSCHDTMMQPRYWQMFESPKLYQSIFSWIKTMFHKASAGS